MKKIIDLSGQQFGFWKVLHLADKNRNGQTQWLCQCECGTQKVIVANSLRSYNSTSCGCNHSPDLTNNNYGKLTVLKKEEDHKDKTRRYWNCKCECDGEIIVSTYQLRNNIVTCCNNCRNKKAPISSSKQKAINLQIIVNDQNLVEIYVDKNKFKVA